MAVIGTAKAGRLDPGRDNKATSLGKDSAGGEVIGDRRLRPTE